MLTSEKNISIAPFTHYKIGGVAREVYFPSDIEELYMVLSSLYRNKTPYYIFGGGSNVLVGDGFWEGAVVMTARMNGWEALPDRFVCGAGLPSSQAAEIALEHSRTGLEFLYLLPGSIGGALAGNARYDYRSMSDAIISLKAVHPEQGVREFSKEEIDFSYKRTSITREGWIIGSLTLGWSEDDPREILRCMEEIRNSRTIGRHFDYPSCGCVFKNDYARNVQAGRLIDSLGLKGLTVGGAKVADFHANFIINTGKATARDVLTLIEQIEQIVFERTGIVLEREVRLAGTF
ncbi:MAG: UDP-N-acetylmuramate dehydrogenase [Candidatus Latescibacter sp.]|nr:UDP-N-acetylmuramate dehydrogenase [Candidatus Latescibacter sp.]